MIKSNVSKEKIKFFILTTLTIILSILDNLFTYMGSPDLSRESNPLVHTLGFNWFGLIISNVLLACFYIFVSYYSFIIFKPDRVQCHGFKEYFSMLNFNRPDKFIWTFYKRPSNKRIYSYAFACFGFFLAYLVPVIRFRASLEWFLFLYNKPLLNSYLKIIDGISFTTFFGRFDYILMVFLILISSFVYWFYKQYRMNKKAINDTNS